MKLNSIQQQPVKQNFKGSITNKVVDGLVNHPGAVALLAGSSVVAQKIVMSGSEAVVGPVMDVGIGKAITKITKEEDGRTNESSKTQAIRTFSQSVGGTIVGIGVRLVCIGLTTYAFMKAGSKTGESLGGKIADVINKDKLQNSEKGAKYLYKDNMEKWGKNVGGALATVVMLATNFLIDAPFINWINKKVTDKINGGKKAPTEQNKEVK